MLHIIFTKHYHLLWHTHSPPFLILYSYSHPSSSSGGNWNKSHHKRITWWKRGEMFEFLAHFIVVKSGETTCFSANDKNFSTCHLQSCLHTMCCFCEFSNPRSLMISRTWVWLHTSWLSEKLRKVKHIHRTNWIADGICLCHYYN